MLKIYCSQFNWEWTYLCKLRTSRILIKCEVFIRLFNSGMSKLRRAIHIHWSLRSRLKCVEHEFVLSFEYLCIRTSMYCDWLPIDLQSPSSKPQFLWLCHLLKFSTFFRKVGGKGYQIWLFEHNKHLTLHTALMLFLVSSLPFTSCISCSYTATMVYPVRVTSFAFQTRMHFRKVYQNTTNSKS